ncbi:sigma-70 family rna polymerase sigma factor : RNA polymerase sigma factor, sigma-70 family OS=Singulisphaera acidiphila (strain ATCC BAA-1392 / DSM 18658 / VKM B-2454 / MOB10) GN=Sinac_4592 PE=4 SV=1: Sigma70_r2: Sigma70_r4_2 [Gemmataceae bacterium]|nr:sigma-70 family rna polymerase sigma factor : RNA polymerase sigma factor, sigma-70 family OS=Singulisphaera acidiphila (strain ATCC BAA-1392 / DSM 18658 / VKM B-2454 / MOB10) GN=Sinac_4592 PE=4 SV=1: Sigma70_r2: Sigma70_r4_2 [Gemmataceae bacterium]VTU01759.1 sigma-70 family rna polymerase sigma factor : RNA polymerase sigma factor, sigma-70 family OS=Singulisphaera acidiphila (strain ATCC BAA-1392 / DSM 18658 / VKM B-2454 / MOB10) GN=Sinac_4592 PE=4 SV=1: Sigma70_r2: Sigma70_r4_2 [Gemmataceae 
MHARQLLDLAHRATDADPAAADATLLGRFADHRDPAAFEALVRRHGPMVWAVCRQTLHNPADAEDAFQATFLALVRSARRVRGAALPAWLHRVAVRAAVRVRRGAARRQSRERAAAATEADRPVPDAAWSAALAAVHEEVARLPEGERVAFVLCDLEGVRQPDAAARLGWKPGTLTGRLARARRTLLDRLTRRGVSPAALGVAAAVADGVPVGAAQRVRDWAGGAPAPAGILKLVSEVVPVTNRIKLWVAAGTAACGVVLAGVGTVRPPTAEAQPPEPRVPIASGSAAGVPLTPPRPADPFAAPAGRATWEYAHVDLPPSPAEFEDLLAMRARDRWEYAGVVDAALFTRNRPDKARIVFKRPHAQAAATTPRVAVPAVPAPPTPPTLPAADDTTVRLAEIALQRAEVQLAAAKTAFDLATRAGREALVSKKEQDELRLKVETAGLDVAEAKVRLDAARGAAAPQTVPPPAGP